MKILYLYTAGGNFHFYDMNLSTEQKSAEYTSFLIRFNFWQYLAWIWGGFWFSFLIGLLACRLEVITSGSPLMLEIKWEYRLGMMGRGRVAVEKYSIQHFCLTSSRSTIYEFGSAFNKWSTYIPHFKHLNNDFGSYKNTFSPINLFLIFRFLRELHDGGYGQCSVISCSSKRW